MTEESEVGGLSRTQGKVPGRGTKRSPTRPGPGSWRVLGWLGRLGAAGNEPLALALELHNTVVYSHLRRLAAEGLVRRELVGDGGGAVTVITRAGSRAARERDLPGIVASGAAASSTLAHSRAVSWVAASATRRGVAWLGPNELRDDVWRVRRDDGAAHHPDLGVVTSRGTRVAVEVELQRKTPRRLQAILAGYRILLDAGQVGRVSYVTNRESVTRLVMREATNAALGDRFEVGSLARVQQRARTGG